MKKHLLKIISLSKKSIAFSLVFITVLVLFVFDQFNLLEHDDLIFFLKVLLFFVSLDIAVTCFQHRKAEAEVPLRAEILFIVINAVACTAYMFFLFHLKELLLS